MFRLLNVLLIGLVALGAEARMVHQSVVHESGSRFTLKSHQNRAWLQGNGIGGRQWKRTLSADVLTDITMTIDELVVISGSFQGNMTIADINLEATGDQDVFVLTFSAETGEVKGVYHLGGRGWTRMHGLFVADGDVHLTAAYERTRFVFPLEVNRTFFNTETYQELDEATSDLLRIRSLSLPRPVIIKQGAGVSRQDERDGAEDSPIIVAPMPISNTGGTPETGDLGTDSSTAGNGQG